MSSKTEVDEDSQDAGFAERLEEVDRVSRGWIHSRPLGKLQRIVKYVLVSSQRREEFADIKGDKKVEEFDHLGVS